MGKLKRVLASSCICLLAFASIPVCMAETGMFTDVDTSTNVGKAVENLVNLGVLNGYAESDGTSTFRPDNTITRAEFAKIVVARSKDLAQVAEVNVGRPAGFADVDGGDGAAEHWAQKFILTALEAKIVTGFPDGSFQPEAPVTYSQAVTMLLRALNYDAVAVARQQQLVEQNGDMPWYSGYMAVAAEVRLTLGVATTGPEDPAPRGTVAVLTNNSYNVNSLTNIITSDGQGGFSTGGSSLEIDQNKKRITGKVVAVHQNSLVMGVSCSKNEVVLEVSAGNMVIYSLENDFDMTSFLGYRIVAYISEDRNYSYDLLTTPSKDGNTLTTVTADRIVATKITSSGMSYYREGTQTREDSVSYEAGMTVVYNGRAYDYLAAGDTLQSVMSEVKTGSIDFLDNNGNGMQDVAFVNSYECFAVKQSQAPSTDKPYVRIYASVTDGRPMYGDLADSSLSTGYIDIPERSDNIYDVKFIVNGTTSTQYSSGMLTEWNMVAIARSKEGSLGKRVFTVIVSKEQQQGSPQDYNVTERTVTINGKKYSYAHNYVAYSERGGDEGSSPVINDIPFDTSITVYVDFQGNIGAVKPLSQSVSNYKRGYLMNVKHETTAGSRHTVARIFSENGQVITATFAPTLKVDRTHTIEEGGVSTTYPATYTTNTAAATNDDPTVGILAHLKGIVARNGLNQETSPGTSYSVKNGEYGQLIRYSISSGNRIDNLDTLSDEPLAQSQEVVLSKSINQYTFSKQQGSATVFNPDTGTGTISANSSALVLFVPEDRHNADHYALRSLNDFVDGSKYFLESYGETATGAPRVLIQYITNPDFHFSVESSTMLVTKVTNATIDGEERSNISGWVIPADKSAKVIHTTIATDKRVAANTLKAGDVFIYTNTPKKRIDKFKIIASASDALTSGPLAAVSSKDAALAARVFSDDGEWVYDANGNPTSMSTTPAVSGIGAKRFTMFGTATRKDDEALIVVPFTQNDTGDAQFTDETSKTASIDALNNGYSACRLDYGGATILRYDASSTNAPIVTANINDLNIAGQSDGNGDMGVTEASKLFVITASGVTRLIFILKQ